MRMISLPVQILLAIAIVVLFGNFFSLTMVSLFYTISVLIKQWLSIILPFMVFSFVTAGILSFKKSAPLVLSVLLTSVICSNGLVAMISYLVMKLLFPVIACSTGQLVIQQIIAVQPLFELNNPFVIPSEYALLAALVSGLIFSWLCWAPFDHAIRRMQHWVELLLNYTIIPILPLFMFGFLLKIRAEGMFSQVMQQYGIIFLIIILLQVSYLWWLYWVASGFNLTEAVRTIRNALPSYITAFGTMSSNATIPVTIASAQKNINNPALAKVAMPILANIHLLGESISTPILALATLIIFKGCLPGLSEYLWFVFYFCTAMFAAAGVPGGGILVMVPILESQLHCTNEMSSIITVLYFLLDAFGTATNVMGDGGLVIIVNNILHTLGLRSEE